MLLYPQLNHIRLLFRLLVYRTIILVMHMWLIIFLLDTVLVDWIQFSIWRLKLVLYLRLLSVHRNSYFCVFACQWKSSSIISRLSPYNHLSFFCWTVEVIWQTQYIYLFRLYHDTSSIEVVIIWNHLRWTEAKADLGECGQLRSGKCGIILFDKA